MLVPPAVFLEIAAASEFPAQANVDHARAAGWMALERPETTPYLQLLGAKLGRGEAEAIALAAGRPDTVLLIDEAEGRTVALKCGIEIVGTAGILLRARNSGDIVQLKPLLDLLMTQYRFRLSRAIYEQLIAGE